MSEYFEIPCPHCGEPNDIDLEPDTEGEVDEVCQGCGEVIPLQVRLDDYGDLDVRLRRLPLH